MEYRLRESVLNLCKSSYAKESSIPQDFSDFIDCSSGINPYGFSNQVATALRALPLEAIHIYPEANADLKKTIVDYWQDVMALEDHNILFGSGSIDIIYKINKLFLDNQSKVLGYSPQFSDYIDDIQSYGGIYDYHLMSMENNFKFKPQLFLEKMNKEHKLIYIDNPNNPTGQIIDLAAIEEIVKRAQSLGICVVVDEAYGDFMNKSNSAIALLKHYNNVFVLRTFSKGLGLAGIRGGYLVTSSILADYYNKVSNPYTMNGIAHYLTMAALKDEAFIEKCKETIRAAKAKLMNSLHKFIILETDLAIPIMTIKHPDSQVNLEEMLKGHHILSVSGESFIGLDKSFVRLRIPSDIDSLVHAFAGLESSI